MVSQKEWHRSQTSKDEQVDKKGEGIRVGEQRTKLRHDRHGKGAGCGTATTQRTRALERERGEGGWEGSLKPEVRDSVSRVHAVNFCRQWGVNPNYQPGK